jgi:hypothetical protein
LQRSRTAAAVLVWWPASGRRKDTVSKMQSRIANSVRSAILRRYPRHRLRAEGVSRVIPVDAVFRRLHRFCRRSVAGVDIAYVDVIDRPRHSGVSNYGFDRLWIRIMDLAGVCRSAARSDAHRDR